jgi:phospholipase/carboxylesterase
MFVFARSLPRNCWLVSPRAPFRSPNGGFSWVDSPRSLDVPFDEFQTSAQRLVEWLDQLEEIPPELRNQVHLVGFSQGAAMCCTIALTYPQRLIRLAGLSGFMPQGADKAAAGRPLQGKACLVSHGTTDDLVPVELAREAVRVLEMAGAAVQYCEDSVGHKLSAACFKRLQGFFAPGVSLLSTDQGDQAEKDP